MTTQDYKLVALAISETIHEFPETRQALEVFAVNFKDVAKEDNPRFSFERFMIAAFTQ